MITAVLSVGVVYSGGVWTDKNFCSGHTCHVSTQLVMSKNTGRPGGVSGYPRAWYRSVSLVRIPPGAYSYKIVGTFSRAQIDLRKARERELATLDEKSTSSRIAEPYAR